MNLKPNDAMPIAGTGTQQYRQPDLLWRLAHKRRDYAVFDDRGSSGSSFLMGVGETLGDCMQRLGERYEVISPVE
jgi:hypothetical protein